MNNQFTQPHKVVTVETNKQAIARDFGIKQSEVLYIKEDAILDGYKAVYDKASQRAYSLPFIPQGHTVVSFNAGILTTSNGSYDLGKYAVSLGQYVHLASTFSTGFTLTTANEVVKDGNNFFRWEGTLPKVVDANSTITNTGGISKGAWVAVEDGFSIRLPFTGTTKVTQHDLNIQIVTATMFGAIGDGTYHPLSESFTTLADAQTVYPHATALTQSVDWAALQSAINWSGQNKLPVLCPKDYYVNDVLTIEVSGVSLMGAGHAWSEGATIRTAGTANHILFKISKTSTLSDFKLVGASTAQPLNTLIDITDTNAVRLQNMFLEKGYRQILLKGTSFYISMDNCDFYGSLYTALETNSSSYSGVDFILTHSRFLDHTGEHVVLLNGLGSAIMSDIQSSVNNTSKTTIKFGIPADGFGGCQMINCVWETDANIAPTAIASVYVEGTAAKPWKSLWFDNCIITGNAIPALLMLYANGVKLSNCGLSSTSIVGVVYYNATGSVVGVSFNNCEWSTGGSNAPIRMGAVVKADLSLVNCTYIGSNVFIDLGAAVYANITFINVANCNLGNGTTPVSKTSDGFWPIGSIITRGHQLGGFTKIVALVATGANGAGNVAHGVKDGAKRIAMISGVYAGGSKEAIAVNPSLFIVDGGSVYINGGVANTRYRITLLFNEAVDVGW